MSRIPAVLIVTNVILVFQTCAWNEFGPIKKIRQPSKFTQGKKSLLEVLAPCRKSIQSRERIENEENQFLSSILGEKKEVVDSYIRRVMQCKHVPGLSVAVVGKAGQSWTEGYGVKDVVSGKPVDSRTMFGVGSLTKAFTSALLAIALQQADRLGNQISWQTRVKELLDEDLVLVNHLEDNVTLEDVLAHRTDLMAADLMAVAGFPARMSRARFIRELRHLPTFLPFRMIWHYNNWIYSLASDVTEHVLGDKWNALLKESLLLPLGMKDSFVVWDDINVTSSKMARPYQRIRGALQEVDASVFDLRQGKASGALAVTADDMVKWMRFLLSEGLLPSGDRLLSKRLTEDLMSSHTPLNGSYDDVPSSVRDKFDGYGFGWFTGSYRGHRTVSHPGGWFGYTCSLMLFPQDGVAVFVSTNGPGSSAGNDAFRAVSYFLGDLVLGYPPWLNQSTACNFGVQSENADGGDKRESPHGEDVGKTTMIKNAHKYAGNYSNPLFGEVLIKNSSSHHGLVLQLQRLEGFLIPGEKEYEFQVQYTGRTEFYSVDDFEVKRSKLTFSMLRLTPDGKSASLVLRAPPPEDFEGLEFTRKE